MTSRIVIMESMREQTQGKTWPDTDPEGRSVRFSHRESRPRPDEYVPVVEGEAVRLEPMQEGHLEALCAVGSDPEIFHFMPGSFAGRADMEAYVRDALSARANGTAIPFVTVLRGQGRKPDIVVGATRFGNIDPHRAAAGRIPGRVDCLRD